MQLYIAERYLAYLYTICGFCSLLCTICMAIVWTHWRIVLNTCAGNFQTWASYYDEKDCGCILFAKDTLSYFVGGEVGHCYWVTLGLILPLAFCVIFGIFHVFRVCFKTKGKPRSGKMQVRQRSTEIMQLTIEQDVLEEDVSPYYWTPAGIIALIMLIYTIIHAIWLSSGVYQTCKQYRNQVVKNLHASGQMVGVIQGRLSCAAIFDFMDYLHPDLSYERRRDYRINTSIPIILAVVAAWIAVGCWLGILIVNFLRFRASRGVRI